MAARPFPEQGLAAVVERDSQRLEHGEGNPGKSKSCYSILVGPSRRSMRRCVHFLPRGACSVLDFTWFLLQHACHLRACSYYLKLIHVEPPPLSPPAVASSPVSPARMVDPAMLSGPEPEVPEERVTDWQEMERSIPAALTESIPPSDKYRLAVASVERPGLVLPIPAPSPCPFGRESHCTRRAGVPRSVHPRSSGQARTARSVALPKTSEDKFARGTPW